MSGQVLTKKILFIQTAFLGDLFLSIPILKKIKSRYPQSQLTLLCRKNLGEFFLKNHIVDEVIEVDKKSKTSLKEAFERTKIFSPNLIISAHQSLRTAIWVWRLSANESVGFRNLITFWAYTKTIRRNLKLHDALRQLSLFGDAIKFEDKELYSKVDVQKNKEYETLGGAVAIAPGSQWATKKWTEAGFVEVAKKLHEMGRKVVLVGSPEEEEIGKRIQSQIPGVISFIGKTSIYQLSQLLSQCSVLVSNDSGPMHVAASVGTPVVAIFGPTVSAQGYTPWSTRYKIVEVNLACRPCGAHGHQVCPIKTHDCMRKISPLNVIHAVEGLAV